MQENSGSAVAIMSDDRRDLIGDALTQLFDFVTGTGQARRIGVFSADSPNKFKWIGLSQLEDTRICGVTNDWFDIVPTEPSFYSCDRDPAVVFEAAINFLCTEFAGEANFRVQLHLGTDEVLHANTADERPRLAPATEVPSV